MCLPDIGGIGALFVAPAARFAMGGGKRAGSSLNYVYAQDGGGKNALTEPMKILHVVASVAPRYGGPSKVVIELCREIAKFGHEMTIFATNIDGKQNLNLPLDQPVFADGVKIRYFPVQWPRSYKFSCSLLEGLRVEIPKFDVVHVHSLYLFHTLIAAHYCRKYSVPYIIRPHGTLDPYIRKRHSFRKRAYDFFFEKRNLDGAAAIHYTTEGERDLAASLQIKAESVIVPLGVDSAEYAVLPPYGTFRKRYPQLEDRKIILFLSRINFKKGLDILAHAMGKIIRNRDDVHIVLAGPDNEGYGKKVRQWLEKEGVLPHSLFTGMLLGEDKLAVLRDSDLFVLPSYSENFGIAVVEAMACGLPVVISNRVNIWREVAEAGAGVITDCDPSQVAEAILELVDDRELRMKMGKNGKRLVEQNFTWSKAAEKMIEVYTEIRQVNINAGK